MLTYTRQYTTAQDSWKMATILPHLLRSTRSRPLIFRFNVAQSQRLHYSTSTNSYTPNAVSHQTIASPPNGTGRPKNKKKERKRLRRLSKKTEDPTMSSGILRHEIETLIRDQGISVHSVSVDLIQHYRQRGNTRIIDDLKILKLSSTGQGIAVCPSEEDDGSHLVIVVPFVTQGDIVKVQLGVHFEHYAEGHLLDVKTPSSRRNDDLVGCKYFTKCSGCQLQMMSYHDQLKFKTDVVKNAYRQFGFDSELLPIMPTTPSPLHYKYRSKLTPHFNGNRENIGLGFEKAGPGKGLLDVDECAIATDVVSNALKNDRLVLENIVRKYKNGGTILLRDKSIDGKESYTTDHSEIITQRINEHNFQFSAGEFFQNNNSILPVLLDHIKGYIDPTKHKNIIDTYCGSGFFGISLSKYAERLIGIEISKGSLMFAQHNAELNNITNSQFLLGSSEEIFKGLGELNPQETIVILDPSRKGSNADYLTQLSRFKPSLIVYVSCNVFSQARDLNVFFNETENGQEYELKVVTGYDFFPQTKHVESLAVLELKK